MKFITNLTGFSGCTLRLYSDNSGHFVRKISKNKEYNERLKIQKEKQEQYAKEHTSPISAPKVLDDGYLDEKYYFDMEYIHGVTVIDYIANANIDDLIKISKLICHTVNTASSKKKERKLTDFQKRIKEKLDSIKSNSQSVAVKDELGKLLLFSQKLTHCNELQETFCHGDLTMENMIYDPAQNKMFLVDFLDSFINHYWFDITTLFQDIEGHWYNFRNPNIKLNNMVPKLNFVKSYIINSILANEEDYKKQHYFMLALKFSRIVPYAKDEDLYYLKQTISKFVKNMNGGVLL